MEREPSDRLIFRYLRPPDRQSTFESDLLYADDGVIITAHELSPKKTIFYDDVPVLEAGDKAFWFLFKGQPYDVARIYTPAGVFRGYYVDVLEPITWTGSDPHSLQPLVDLFLDLWVTPDAGHAVLDEVEFREAETRKWLSPQQSRLARQTLAGLVWRIEVRTFPPPEVVAFRPERRHVV